LVQYQESVSVWLTIGDENVVFSVWVFVKPFSVTFILNPHYSDP